MSQQISKEIFLKAFRLMATAKTMAEKYEANKEITSKYVHATSRGHEAIQLALGMPVRRDKNFSYMWVWLHKYLFVW